MALILKILSILGITVLVILGIIILLILLVLFLPVFYRIKADKNEYGFSINAKASWLFGFARAKAIFPEPGNITVKLLFYKVFDSADKKAIDDKPNEKYDTKTAKCDKNSEESHDAHETVAPSASDSYKDKEITDDSNPKPEHESSDGAKKNLKDIISDKYTKIVYTIRNLYDKIKDISENIDFYKNLLSEDSTVELMNHAVRRLKLILKNIRPRRLRAKVVFGAATPDITGYVYGIYGMFASALGKKVCFTPDFCNKVFEGDVYASGHITVFTVLFNAGMIMFDKKLKLLRRKLKRHSLGKDNKGRTNRK